ncbi:hypothetical protein [Shewanella mangrovisoli]|uniref:hypothetical protein n=1 Tax=Shewanella mangrovisoli TaxID=2864211 RepID=UPI0035B6E38E
METTTNNYIPLAQSNSSEWSTLSNLLVLGFISSVESYIRCLLRRLLLVDEESMRKSYNHSLTYGAAIHHNKLLMPEALMEENSFHSAYNIKETIKSMTGVNLNSRMNDRPELKSAFSDFDFIGELRHCVVHRSGMFGSNNALSLGLDEYQLYLEKPIKLDLRGVQEAANACDNLVKELNDVMFSEILMRTVSVYDWRGDLRFDKKYFDKYFYLFAPSSNHGLRKETYAEFRDVTNLKFRNGNNRA